MKIEEIEFIGSFPHLSQCPAETMPEYAFIGRSNVGKSSLINMLLGRKNVAHTSQKPGKTQLLNYYLINKSWYIVDLPGYGYAKISKKMRRKWEQMIESYLKKRETMMCAMVLIDGNVSPQQNDIEFINWLGERHIPFVLVYTKADKARNPEIVEQNIQAFREALLEHWEELPQEFITSANEKLGRRELLSFFEEVNERTKYSL